MRLGPPEKGTVLAFWRFSRQGRRRGLDQMMTGRCHAREVVVARYERARGEARAAVDQGARGVLACHPVA